MGECRGKAAVDRADCMGTEPPQTKAVGEEGNMATSKSFMILVGVLSLGACASEDWTAMSESDRTLVSSALAGSVPVNEGAGKGGTALHAAVKTCNLEAVQQLVAHGADVNAVDKDGHPPLWGLTNAFMLREMGSCKANDTATIRLFKAKGVDINDARNAQVLFELVRQGDYVTVSLLGAEGANPNIRGEHGRTPIFFAPGHATIGRLLAFGADPLLKDDSGVSAMAYFRQRSYNNPVNDQSMFYAYESLVNAGFKDDSVADSGNLSVGQRDFVKASLAAKDPARRDDAGNTPLHYAVLSGSWPMVSAVLGLKPDVNAANKEDETPIFFVARNREEHERSLNSGALNPVSDPDAQIIEALKAAGAKIEYRSSKSGSTVGHLAVKAKLNFTARRLIDKGGVPLSTLDSSGNLAVCYSTDPNLTRFLNGALPHDLSDGRCGKSGDDWQASIQTSDQKAAAAQAGKAKAAAAGLDQVAPGKYMYLVENQVVTLSVAPGPKRYEIGYQYITVPKAMSRKEVEDRLVDNGLKRVRIGRLTLHKGLISCADGCDRELARIKNAHDMAGDTYEFMP